MNPDYLSELPVDLFLKQITHLPYQSVIAVCSSSKKLQRYCSAEYSIKWRALIDNTFSSMSDYAETVKRIQNKLQLTEKEYDYRVYVQLMLELLDPVTQAMIAYRQEDMESFNRFNDEIKSLALFILGDRKNIETYLPRDEDNDISYPYYSIPAVMDTILILRPKVIGMATFNALNEMVLNSLLYQFARYGNLRGVKMMESKGAVAREISFTYAAQEGYLDLVIYLLDKYNFPIDRALDYAIQNNHLNVVKYLVEHSNLTPEQIIPYLDSAKGEIRDYLLSKINQY